MKKIALFVFVVGIMSFNFTLSHSGGTDDTGCHTDHSTGIYHCH